LELIRGTYRPALCGRLDRSAVVDLLDDDVNDDDDDDDDEDGACFCFCFCAVRRSGLRWAVEGAGVDCNL